MLAADAAGEDFLGEQGGQEPSSPELAACVSQAAALALPFLPALSASNSLVP